MSGVMNVCVMNIWQSFLFTQVHMNYIINSSLFEDQQFSSFWSSIFDQLIINSWWTDDQLYIWKKSFVCLFICLCLCFFVCLFVWVFICVFVCLFVCLCFLFVYTLHRNDNFIINGSLFEDQQFINWWSIFDNLMINSW